jgi:hypothetical protein
MLNDQLLTFCKQWVTHAHTPLPASGQLEAQSGMPRTQPKAPVANMAGGSGSSSAIEDFSRPTSRHELPPIGNLHDSSKERARSDSLKEIELKYPYLYEIAMTRDQIYQSPYAAGGGFTEAYLPNPVAHKRRPRGTSLTQDFLNRSSPSIRENLKSHVRQISTEKAMMKIQEQERILREQKQRAILKAQQLPPIGQMMYPQSFSQQPFYHTPTRPNYSVDNFNPSFSSPHYPDILGSNLFSHPPRFDSPGLNFSSPQDFRMQMQQERKRPADLNTEPAAYDAFFNGLGPTTINHPPTNGHGHRGSNGTADGTSGSPLRRDAGGEMLPMMQDRML